MMVYRLGRFQIGTSNLVLKLASYSTTVDVKLDQAVEKSRSTLFRTSEDNPVNHGPQHEALYYTVPPDVKKTLFQHGGLPKSFAILTKTFRETCLMVRKPALELIQYLNAADYSCPTIRYALYGKPGCGKSMILAHILHHGHVSGCILVHVPWVSNWTRRCKEVANSPTKEGYTDLPLDAAAWLIHFRTQNETLLNQLNLKVTREYVWSKRETTPEGAPLLELVELGISRVKYATGCIAAILKEIKEYSTKGRCKTLVVIDGFNAFFHEKTRVFAEHKVVVPPSKLTITEPFLDITKFDWCNGAVVVSIDQIAAGPDKPESDLPMYQLGRQGFEHLDPFVPILVSEYSDKEVRSCVEYYYDRRWIQNKNAVTEQGIEELAAMSAHIPRELMIICGPL